MDIQYCRELQNQARGSLGADSGYVEASARIAAWERALLHALRPYSGQGWAWNVVTPFTVHL